MLNPLAGLPPRLLRTKEAARFLGISIRTLEKHRTYGTGPTYRKVGGRVLYTVRDLEDWSAAGERKSTRDKTAGTVFPARPLTPEERGDCQMLREDDHAPALPGEDSERSRLDPFVVATGDAPPRDQRDLMERPFFSLAKTPRTKPILYKAADIEVQVFGMPEHGMATIWDADVLIWAASQIVAAENNGLTTSRFVRFTPYHLLRAIGRPTGNHQYRLLKAALARLQSTVIATTIRNGPHWRRRQFSWINEWEEMTTRAGRVEGMEFVLPEWFYNSVIDRSLVLTIDPAYFRLTGGIERWLYRVARKHAGHQRHGWVFEVAHLHQKSGSLARPSDFALDLRRIAARQQLPGYLLQIEREDGRELLRIRPEDLSTGTVDNPVNAIGRSGARGIGRSGASLSADQAHEPQLTLWPETRNPTANLSNRESNSFYLTRARAKRGAGSARKGEP